MEAGTWAGVEEVSAPALARGAVVVALLGAPLLAVAPAAHADTVGSDFETLTLGPVNAQDGWTSTGAAGTGCAVYDHAVADNALFSNDPPSFGAKSLRISNAVTSGCFSDHTFSKKTVDEAGEPTASAGAFGSGTRYPSYTGQFSFVPTTSTPQPGLSVVVSPDRGDGARMSWLQIADTGAPGGLDLSFTDYRDVAPLGSNGTPSDGCTGLDNFQQTTVASGISRNAAHTVKIVMAFVPGQGNDVVKVYLDGVLEHTGTSWEDYFRFCEATLTSRTVRSLLFRTGGTAVPGLAGQGLLFDAVSSTTSAIPLPAVSIGSIAVVEGQSGTTTANVPVTLSTSYPYPVTVKYWTENGAAKAPQDYQEKFGTFTIPANTTSANLPISIVGDTTLEKNEAFKVKLSNSTNATIMTPTGTLIGTVTILNDELPRVIVKAPSAKEGAVSVVTIALKDHYAYPLSLLVHTANGTASAPGDFTAVNTTVSFAPQSLGPKSVFVAPKKDGLTEVLETYAVVVSGGSTTVSRVAKIPGNRT